MCIISSDKFSTVEPFSGFKISGSDWIYLELNLPAIYKMTLRNKVTPDQTNKQENNVCRHGILHLPLTIMLPFGLQLFNKIIGYFINLMFFFNYGLILALTILRFISVEDYDETVAKFFTGFAFVMMIKFTNLLYMYFRRYNLGMLLQVITRTRRYSLLKKELFFVIIIFIAVVTMVIYVILYFSHRFVLPILTTGSSRFLFAFETKDPVASRVAVILEILIFMDVTWISVLATSFLLNVITVVLGREFDKCIENLQEKVNDTETLSGDTFSETVERFKKLRGVVEKMDDIFFLDFTFNLGLSLGMLCGSFYGIYVGDLTYEDMHIPILVSMVTVLIILPPSAALHSKVTASSSSCGSFVGPLVFNLYACSSEIYIKKLLFLAGSQYY